MLARVNVFTIAVIAAGAGLVSAQSISPECLATLKVFLASPDSACLNPSALLSFALTGSQSISVPVNNWLTGLCATNACSNATLSTIVTNIATGCSTDLSDAFGYSSNDTSDIVDIVQAVYPTIRKTVCLKDTTSNQLCVPETISNIENITGTLNFQDVGINDVFSDAAKVLTSSISNLTCTSCVQAAYTIVRQDFPDAVSDVTGPLGSLCGSSFVDGTTPSTITQTADAKQLSAENSGITSWSPVSGAGAALGLVASIFATLV